MTPISQVGPLVDRAPGREGESRLRKASTTKGHHTTKDHATNRTQRPRRRCRRPQFLVVVARRRLRRRRRGPQPSAKAATAHRDILGRDSAVAFWYTGSAALSQYRLKPAQVLADFVRTKCTRWRKYRPRGVISTRVSMMNGRSSAMKCRCRLVVVLCFIISPHGYTYVYLLQ